MFQYALKRLLGILPTLAIVAFLVFFFVHLLPGDPARLAAGQDATPETVQMVREDLGLDKPLHVQFVRWAGGIAHGDFGRSLRSKRPVSVEIGERFLPTLWLTLWSMAWAVLVRPRSSASSRRSGGTVGPIGSGWRFAVSGISFPAFALGLVGMEFFSVKLNWLPTTGADSWRHYILPTFTLGAAVAAVMARFTRSAFVDILGEDYVRTARAKGVAQIDVILRHCLRNALIPVVTMMGLQFGFLLGGSIVVEKVFTWPGLGRLLVDSVEMRDYPVLQALVLLFSLEFLFINLIVDLLYGVIDPQIRYE